MKSVYLLLLLTFTAILPSVAQTTTDPRLDLPKVTPPSPNAASLGKYGDIPVGLYTGIPIVSIPLYEIKLGPVSLPISVSYQSQGLKVEEKSGVIGLGWALSAGGVITRTVKGGPDEGNGGYWTHDASTDSYISSTFASSLAFGNGTFDGQPDMFYFNFGGRSGKFVIDATSAHVVHIIPAQPSLKIKQLNGLNSFQITDEEGVKYIFDVKETTTDESGTANILQYTSAWHLSKIITPAGNMTFSYVSDLTYFYQFSESDHLTNGGSDDANRFNPGHNVNTSYMSFDSKVLTAISTPNESIQLYTKADRKDMLASRRVQGFLVKDYNGVVKKKVAFTQSYFGNSNTASPDDCRLKLDQVIELSADSTLRKVYSFDYNSPTSVPSVRSLSQDYWGYYNGQNNSTLLPYLDPRIYGTAVAGQATTYGNREPNIAFSRVGCLSQITYPTGGTTKFTYESNDYSFTNGDPLDEKQRASIQIQATATKNSTVSVLSSKKYFHINATQSVSLTTQGSYSGAPPVDNGPSVSINLVNSNGTRTNVYNRTVINSSLSYAPSFAVGNYEMIATVDGATQTVTATLQYDSVGATISKKFAGGFRIKEILNTDPVTLNTTVKQFGYQSPTDTTKSSGTLISPINLVSQKISHAFAYSYTVRSSGTNNYLGSTQGSIIGYGVVTERDGNLNEGKKISYFTTSADYPNTFGTDSLVGVLNSVIASNNDSYKNKYLNDYDFARGLLTKEMFYNSSSQLVKQTVNQYNVGTALSTTSPNYFMLKSRAGLMFATCSSSCSQCSDVSRPCDQFQINNIYIFHNQIICPWIYKTQAIETVYDETGLNPLSMSTNYYYENPLHGQITKQEFTNSKGVIVKNINKYAQDKNQINGLTTIASLAIDSMVIKNMVTTVLENEQYTNGTFSSRLRTNYRIWDSNGAIVAPDNVQFQSYIASALETRNQFTSYDNVGNLLEVSKSYGPSTAYQWGYNKQYPVASAVNAKIKNMYYDGFEEGSGNSTAQDSYTGHYSYLGTYSRAMNGLDNGSYLLTYWQKLGNLWSLVMNTVSVSTGSYAISLSGQIDDVRFYPASAQMTTSTFDPLTGITSSTDPKSNTTFYEYDTFQRLKTIKDHNGDIVKSFSYNYSIK